MFIAALFIRAKRWKQLECPSVDEYVNKIQYISTAEYYLATKMNEVLIHGTTQINLKNIALSEISQMQKPCVL